MGPAVVINVAAARSGGGAVSISGRTTCLSLAEVADLARDLAAAGDWAAALEREGPDEGAGEGQAS